MKADAVVRARTSAETKDKAMAALDRMGLSASDLIRLTFLRVAEEGRLPLSMQLPNRTTRKAMAELDAGHGKRFRDEDELFRDLDI